MRLDEAAQPEQTPLQMPAYPQRMSAPGRSALQANQEIY